MLIRRPSKPKDNRATCSLCGKALNGVGTCIGICPHCLRARPEESWGIVELVHAQSREMFGLPAKAASDPEGMACNLCFKNCRLAEGRKGYCGIRKGNRKSFRADGRSRAQVSYYYDPLPTNCVADWVCPGGTGVGYPQYSNDSGPEVGFYNLAVFFEACNFNCLYCQNWTFRKTQLCSPRWVSVDTLKNAVKADTSCICFFGGDPGPQLPFALRLSDAVRRENPEKILRICWETNGAVNPLWLKKMVKISSQSGGCIKVDLKAWSEGIHRALCGCGNRQVLENFKRIAGLADNRPAPPLLVASTPLVPGYIDAEEIYSLAKFIAGIDPDIPYALLAFAPQFLMDDSPTTSAALGDACVEAARQAGLKRVRLGNTHLLS